MILTTHCVQSAQVFRVQNHTLCTIVLACIVSMNWNCSRVFPRVCPDLDFELVGLIHFYITFMMYLHGLNCNTWGQKRPRVERFKPDTSWYTVAKQMTSNTIVAICDIVQMCFVGFSIQSSWGALAGSVALFTYCQTHQLSAISNFVILVQECKHE